MKVPPKRKGNGGSGGGGSGGSVASMKVPPKRKGNKVVLANADSVIWPQ